jgi:hypothetical protein
MTPPTHAELAGAVRDHAGRLAAALVPLLGDFSAAEDLVPAPSGPPSPNPSPWRVDRVDSSPRERRGCPKRAAAAHRQRLRLVLQDTFVIARTVDRSGIDGLGLADAVQADSAYDPYRCSSTGS